VKGMTKLAGVVLALSLAAATAAAYGASAGSHHGHHARAKRGRMVATRIHCGMVVRHSIKVLNNISCPVPAHPGKPPHGTPPFGLLVMGSHITVDLNGHTLTGPRFSGTSRDLQLGHAIEMVGVQLMHAHDVTVEKGTIRHFDAGVDDYEDTHNTFTHLTVQDNHNYEVVNGALDYLPPEPSISSVTATGTGTTTYSYEVVTTQVANPQTTLGDNGTNGHSLTQDSLESSPTSVTNAAPLSASNYNTITFTGAAPNFATGYRILRSIGNGPYVWLGTVLASASNDNTYTFVDKGQAPTSTQTYHAVSLANNDVSVDDSCNNGDGIEVDASSYDTVAHDRLIDNGPFSGVAMIGEFNPQKKVYIGPDHNRILDNYIYHNAVENFDPGFNNPNNRGLSAYCGTGPGGGGMTRGRLVQDSGVRIEGPNAHHNLIKGNTVIGSGFNGVAIHSYVCNSTGPQPNGQPNSYNTITGNRISHTGEFTPAADETDLDGIGWLASGPPGIVCVSPDNTVTDNVSFDNLRDGIFLGGRANRGNYVAHNTVYGNADNGIEASQGAKGFGNPPNRFVDNRGYGNAKDDGFDANIGCSGDTWSGNAFKSVNQPCVK
jgi:parallel beta-helix repeat protein